MKHPFKTAVLGLVLSTTLQTSTLLAAAPVAHGADQNHLSIGQSIEQKSGVTWKQVPTQTLTAGDVNFAYRELGKHHGGTPVVLLTHLAAVLDNWDPRIIDGLAARAQLEALRVWGQKAPANLSVIQQPVLVVNGDDDRMVPTVNTHDLARRLPNSQLILYPDAGHGGIFQFHADFVRSTLDFLVR
jgi:pimeloyl-ACP methyl ester carboxylesterase